MEMAEEQAGVVGGAAAGKSPDIADRPGRTERRRVLRTGLSHGGGARRRLPLSPGRIMGWIAATVFVVILVTESVGHFHHESALVEGLSHILALLGALLPLFYFLWYRPLCQQMHERQRSENEVRHLSHRLLVAGEEERCKLARDLHDEFGQKLTSLQMRLEGLGGRILGDRPELDQSCRQLVTMARELGDDLRLVVADLRPNLLEELGIGSALEVYLADICQQCPDLVVDFSCRGLRERPRPEVEMVLYRVAQEALTNVLKHALASQVTVRLTVSFPQVLLSIQDNGVGFEKPPRRRGEKLSGYGLVGMRERVAAAGGTMDIASRPGTGTRVRVELPLFKEDP